MNQQTTQEIRLDKYGAAIRGPVLRLGTWDSYGIEQLQIIPGPEWEGLVITATFVTPAARTVVLVPENGVLAVPQEATAAPLPVTAPGKIVFAGTASGMQRITADLLYVVTDHAPVTGTAPEPTPSQWEQFVSAVKEDACRASRSASQAADSATAASASAGAAQQSAGQADTSAEKAQNSADDAAQSAKLAQQGAANAGWFTVEGKDGILYFTRSDNAPEDFKLQDNGKGVLEAVYG